jgi:NADH oxidase (H2O2-forming)
MRTSVSDIYAAGDCVETKCAITGRKILMQLATTAVRQAAVAGSNAAGGNEVYNGTTGVATTRLFEHEIASVGLTTAVATRYDLPTLSGRVAARSRLEYMPKGTEIIAKLICKSADGQLVGAQIIGEGASLRANFASQAIRFRMNVSDFQAQETCYAPPNAPVWDPLTLAAQALQRKLEVRQARHDA